MTPTIRSIHLANGVRLQYAEQGDPAGMPVVLLHGITDSWRSFEPVMAHLPASLHVFALSQRGHGESDRPGRYRTRDFAGDAAAFIDGLGLGRSLVVGHSMGSTNAMRLAIDRPDLLRGLMAVGSFATFSDNAGVVESLQPPPLFVVLNAGSGHEDAEVARALIARVLDESGRRHHIAVMDSGPQIAAGAHRAVEQAMAQGGAVVAAGGDGTINTVAQVAHDAGCPMGVVPQSTFNYFSRTHGIPTDTAEAARSLVRSRVEPVQVGLVNDHVFLVNASLGLYPELLEDREQFKARFGRNRLVAWAAGLMSLLREHRQLRLRIEGGGAVRDVRTPTLFIGNNRLQLEQVGISQAPTLDHGCIAAVMLRPVGTWAMLVLLVRGALGTLGDADRVESFQFQRMTVTPRLPYGRQRVKVAADGEVIWMRSPLEFGVSPKPLYLLKPVADGAPAQDRLAGSAAGDA